MDLKAGDVVRLKSGGPPMTVLQSIDYGRWFVRVAWFDTGGQMNQADLPGDAVEPVPQPDLGALNICLSAEDYVREMRRRAGAAVVAPDAVTTWTGPGTPPAPCDCLQDIVGSWADVPDTRIALFYPFKGKSALKRCPKCKGTGSAAAGDVLANGFVTQALVDELTGRPPAPGLFDGPVDLSDEFTAADVIEADLPPHPMDRGTPGTPKGG